MTPCIQKPSHIKGFRARCPDVQRCTHADFGHPRYLHTVRSVLIERTGGHPYRFGASNHTHRWVRIGPYLKCSRCGQLRAAEEKR
jgi:hypothetical protein